MGSGIVVAVVAGAFIAIQVTMMSRAVQGSTPLIVAFLVQCGGAVGTALVLLLLRPTWSVLASSARGWWWLAAGMAGTAVLAALASSSARIGVATALSLAVLSQLFIGLGVDARAGIAAFSVRAGIGVVLLAIGAYLVATR